MATTLTYTISPFVAFTKIRSADVNQYFTDIKNRVNWAGGSSSTTGLGDDNVQSNTVSGGGLTRSSKLKSGTANYVIINDSSGNMTEEAQLAVSRGGLGSGVSVTSPGDVIQVNAGGTGFVSSAPPTPAQTRIFSFYQFS